MLDKFHKQTIAMRYWLKGKQYFKSLRAMELGAKYHIGTRKDNVTPEFSHQIAVASFTRTLTSSLLSPEDTITVAFLHDVTEDYEISFTEIEALFGEEVRAEVSVLDRKLRGGNGAKKSPKNYYEQLGYRPIASIIKGADRIHNFQTMTGIFSLEKQKDYINEAEEFILPMIKKAKRQFPEQEMAYENIKHVLNSQIELIRAMHKAYNK